MIVALWRPLSEFYPPSRSQGRSLIVAVLSAEHSLPPEECSPRRIPPFLGFHIQDLHSLRSPLFSPMYRILKFLSFHCQHVSYLSTFLLVAYHKCSQHQLELQNLMYPDLAYGYPPPRIRLQSMMFKCSFGIDAKCDKFSSIIMHM